MRGKKIEFEKNEKHGRLVVIKPLNKSVTNGKRGKRRIWLFQCDCGRHVECVGSDVKSGRKKSCGCLYEEHKRGCGQRLAWINIKPNKAGPIKKLFGTYQRQALRRGYSWSLTEDEFKEFLFKRCFYCDAEPTSKYNTSSNNPVMDNNLIYNGIDRKNNEIGYSKKNCITACGICNRMKMDLSYERFLEKIKQINTKLNL
jgi:hypothetical protein